MNILVTIIWNLYLNTPLSELPMDLFDSFLFFFFLAFGYLVLCPCSLPFYWEPLIAYEIYRGSKWCYLHQAVRGGIFWNEAHLKLRLHLSCLYPQDGTFSGARWKAGMFAKSPSLFLESSKLQFCLPSTMRLSKVCPVSWPLGCCLQIAKFLDWKSHVRYWVDFLALFALGCCPLITWLLWKL